MPFAVEDFNDLLRLLQAHPDWQSQLRRVVLTDELLSLPETMRDMVAAQRRVDERLVTLGERVAALTEAQRHTDERLAALTDAQRHTDERVAVLTERVTALTDHVAVLTQRVDVLINHVAALRGSDRQRRFAERAPSYLGPAGYRRTGIVSNADLADLLDDAADSGRVTASEREDLLRVDVVARARDGQGEVWLAAELSATVDEGDITRARRRAKVLARMQGRAVAVVGGYAVTDGARHELAADPAVLALTLPAA